MKLKEGFILHKNSHSYVLVDLNEDSKFIIKGNETFAFIIELLKEDRTIEECLEKMLETYDVDKERAKEDLLKIIDSLREIKVIDE